MSLQIQYKLNHMKRNNNVFSILLIVALVLFGGCNDQWEGRTKIKDGLPTADLMNEIKSKPELSQFVDFLVQTGLDKEMEGSRLLTVWAPNNDAFDAVEIPTNDSLLRKLLLNHVSYERVNYSGLSEQFRHKMANGKHLELDTETGTIDGVSLVGDKDNIATNGVLHIVSQVIPLRNNIWEYFGTATQGRNHIDYIISQDRDVFDPELSEQIGVDPISGAPVFDSVMMTVNTYLRDVVDLKDENQQLTYFVFSDATLAMEQLRFSKYFTKRTNAETDSLTLWNVLKDAAVQGEFQLNELDATFISLDGVSFDMQKNAVVESYKASNGMIYVVNNLTVSVAERVKPIFIEAEYPYPDTLDIQNQHVFKLIPDRLLLDTRYRSYASSGYDIFVNSRTSLNPSYIDYIVDNINTVDYQVYWLSAAESNGFTQNLSRMKWVRADTISMDMVLDVDSSFITEFVNPSPMDSIFETSLGVFSVDVLNHSDYFYDTEQGYFRSDNCMRLRVQGSGKSLSLDYIKLVPILD